MSAFDMKHKRVKQHQKDMHTYKIKQGRQDKNRQAKPKQKKTRQNNTKQHKTKAK
jgi:hypothetical protein